MKPLEFNKRRSRLINQEADRIASQFTFTAYRKLTDEELRADESIHPRNICEYAERHFDHALSDKNIRSGRTILDEYGVNTLAEIRRAKVVGLNRWLKGAPRETHAEVVVKNPKQNAEMYVGETTAVIVYKGIAFLGRLLSQTRVSIGRPAREPEYFDLEEGFTKTTRAIKSKEA